MLYDQLKKYNRMTKAELQESYIALKEWLRNEYQDELNARLLMNYSPLHIPVNLNDGMEYIVNTDLELICKGFDMKLYKEEFPYQWNRPVFQELFPDGKLTIIADKITHGNYGSPTVVNAPFCTEFDCKVSQCFDAHHLRKLSLPKLKEIKSRHRFSGLTLDKLDLFAVENIGTEGLYDLSLTSTLKLPNCKIVSAGAFRQSSIEEIEIPNCIDLREDAILNSSKLRSLKLPSNTVYLTRRENRQGSDWKDSLWQSVLLLQTQAQQATSNLAITHPEVKVPKLGNPFYLADFGLSQGIEHSCPEDAKLLDLVVLNDNMIKPHMTNANMLHTVYLPNCRELNHRSFAYCEKLDTIILPKCDILYEDSLFACPHIKHIYLPEALKGTQIVVDLLRNLVKPVIIKFI